MQHRQTLKPESQILRFPAPSDGASETQHCRTLLVLSGGGGGGRGCQRKSGGRRGQGRSGVADGMRIAGRAEEDWGRQVSQRGGNVAGSAPALWPRRGAAEGYESERACKDDDVQTNSNISTQTLWMTSPQGHPKKKIARALPADTRPQRPSPVPLVPASAAARHGTRAAEPPPPGTKWTRRVPHPVLSGHAASLTPY